MYDNMWSGCHLWLTLVLKRGYIRLLIEMDSICYDEFNQMARVTALDLAQLLDSNKVSKTMDFIKIV